MFLLLVGFNLNVAGKVYFKTVNSGLLVSIKKKKSFLKQSKQNHGVLLDVSNLVSCVLTFPLKLISEFAVTLRQGAGQDGVGSLKCSFSSKIEKFLFYSYPCFF